MDSSTLMQFYVNFPKLHPIVLGQRLHQRIDGFEGYIEIMGKDHYITIKTPYFPKAKNISITGAIHVIEAIRYNEIQELPDDSSFFDLLRTLQQICIHSLEHGNSKYPIHEDQFTYYSLLLAHIEVLGWEKVSHISSDFSVVVLQTNDKKNRVHNLPLKILSKYPSEPPAVEADLPIEIDIQWNSNSTVLDVFNIWEECLEKLQAFWDVMDCLDEMAFVLDPPTPSRKHTVRRIILENQVSIHLTVSPNHPFAPPKCHLLGPSSVVGPLNDKIVQSFQNWDTSDSIVSNFEHILGVHVVKKLSRATSVTQELEMDCAVCYCLNLDDQLPDFTCDHCQKSFHLTCLYDWLKSLPSSRQTAQFIRGDCPYCTKAVSCKVPT